MPKIIKLFCRYSFFYRDNQLTIHGIIIVKVSDEYKADIWKPAINIRAKWFVLPTKTRPIISVDNCQIIYMTMATV